MRVLTTALLVAAALALAAPVGARIGDLEPTPAATLLLPYFEVDLADPAGTTTLLSINNASAAPAVANVVLWTDYSFPTVGFNVYLTGFDVVTINLRDIFQGNLPVTGPVLGPVGPLSDPHVNFPGCDTVFPFVNPELSPNQIQRVVNGHTGQPVPSLGGACAGADLGDNVARGYVTVDNLQQCTVGIQTQPGYFLDGGNGIASNVNQLWGDFFIIDSANNFAFGDPLVHIEANDGLNAVNVPLTDPDSGTTVANVANATGYTFYGRYFGPPTGPDNREPLGTIWGARYLNGGAFDGGTSLLVWRDSTATDLNPNPSWCGGGPSWHPLNETEVLAFNEEEDAVEICGFRGDVVFPPDDVDPACFPRETGRYAFGEGDLAVPYVFGWVYLNLNLPIDAPIGDNDFGTDGNIAQSYVITNHSALGRFQVGLPAVRLRGALEDFNLRLNLGGNAPTFP